MNTKRLWENIKNVILVVLFITTTLLLYLLWGGKSSAKLDLGELLSFVGSRGNSVSIEDVLKPSAIAWGEGDGSFRYLSGNIDAQEEYFKSHPT